MTVNGLFTWLGGSVAGNNTSSAHSSTSIRIDYGELYCVFAGGPNSFYAKGGLWIDSSASKILNSRTIDIAANTSTTWVQGRISVSNSASIYNRVGCLFRMAPGGSLLLSDTSTPYFGNQGTIIKDSGNGANGTTITSTTKFQAFLDQAVTGTLRINAGQISLEGGSTNLGLYYAKSGTRTERVILNNNSVLPPVCYCCVCFSNTLVVLHSDDVLICFAHTYLLGSTITFGSGTHNNNAGSALRVEEDGLLVVNSTFNPNPNSTYAVNGTTLVQAGGSLTLFTGLILESIGYSFNMTGGKAQFNNVPVIVPVLDINGQLSTNGNITAHEAFFLRGGAVTASGSVNIDTNGYIYGGRYSTQQTTHPPVFHPLCISTYSDFSSSSFFFVAIVVVQQMVLYQPYIYWRALSVSRPYIQRWLADGTWSSVCVRPFILARRSLLWQ